MPGFGPTTFGPKTSLRGRGEYKQIVASSHSLGSNTTLGRRPCEYIQIHTYIYIYQGAPGLIRLKTDLVFLRSRFDWVKLVKHFHGFARV